jgi:hypothetical protein
MRTSMLVLALMLFPLSAAAQLAPPRTALPPPLPAPWASGAKPPTLTLPGFGAPTATPGYPFPQPLLSPAAPRWGIPVGHHREPAPDRRRWELIAPGIVALVGGYVGWVLTTIMWNSVNNTCNGSTWGLFPSCWFDGRGPDGSDIGRSFLPLVGPWWSIASSQTMRGADLFVPVLAGVGQLAGLVMLIVGLATPVSLAVAEPSIGSVRIDVDASPESAMARLSVALP